MNCYSDLKTFANSRPSASNFKNIFSITRTISSQKVRTVLETSYVHINCFFLGDFFAIPFKSGVKLMSRDQEFLPQKLNCGTENFFSATAFSTNGNHLVGGTVDGKIVFWKLATGAQIAEVINLEKIRKRYPHFKTFCSPLGNF